MKVQKDNGYRKQSQDETAIKTNDDDLSEYYFILRDPSI